MRIAPKATKGKGRGRKASWKKGEACTSNPVCMKYRTKAKPGSIQSLNRKALENFNAPSTSSAITIESLQTHNAINFQSLSLGHEEGGEEQENVMDIGGGGSVKTFASIWSNCTNPCYDAFLTNWTPTSTLQKEMLAVLGTVAEMITTKGGQQGNTEYFAVLMTILDNPAKEDSLPATTELLRILLPRLSHSVLRAKFSTCAKTISTFLEKYPNPEESHCQLVRGLIFLLGSFLSVIPSQSWSSKDPIIFVNNILLLTLHDNIKIRKSARKCILGIIHPKNMDENTMSTLTELKGHPVSHPLVKITCNFCLKSMRNTSVKEDMNKILNLMTLLKLILPDIGSPKELKEACETIMQFMSFSNTAMSSLGFESFEHLFKVTCPNLTPELSVQIMNALLMEFKPSDGETQQICSYLSSLKSIITHLKKIQPDQYIKHVDKIFDVHIGFFNQDSREVKLLLKTQLIQLMEDSSGDSPILTLEHITRLSNLVDKSLDYKYSDAWTTTLDIVAKKFEVYGSKYPSSCHETVKLLVNLRGAQQFDEQRSLDQAICHAIKHMGPPTVLQLVNFGLDDVGLTRSWILPILRQSVERTELKYFVRFVDMADKARREASKQEGDDDYNAKGFDVIYRQIWSIFPSFCNHPTDLEVGFPMLAKTLGTKLKTEPEIRNHILSGFRILAKNFEGTPQAQVLGRYSKNFFPILLNMYTIHEENQGKGGLLPVFETIISYLRVSDPEEVQSLNTRACERYAEVEDVMEKLHYLDLMRAFIPYLNETSLDNVYNGITGPVSGLVRSTNFRLQKKGFRMLEEICRSTSEPCKALVLKKISEILGLLIEQEGVANEIDCSPTAKSAQLNALKHLIVAFFSIMPDEIELISRKLFPMVFASLDIKSERTRIASLELMKTLVSASLMTSDNSQMMRSLLIEYMVDTKTCDKALMCVCYLFDVLLKDKTPEEFQEFSRLVFVPNESRPMCRAVLAFIKTMMKNMTRDECLPYLEPITNWINNVSTNIKRGCREGLREILSRLMRKFGNEPISKMINDELSKVVRNVRKADQRRKKKRFQSDGSDTNESVSTTRRKDMIEQILNESSDEGNEDAVTMSRKSKKPLLQIDERGMEMDDQFDLLSNKSRITVAKKEKVPKKNDDDEDFKYGDDGRIIIAEIEKKKNSQPHSRDDDHENEDDFDKKDLPAPSMTSRGSRKSKAISQSNAGASTSGGYRHGGKGIHRGSRYQDETKTGEAYKSTKARGDVKRKNQPTDPYAYFPLIKASMNRRKKVLSRDQYKDVSGKKKRTN